VKVEALQESDALRAEVKGGLDDILNKFRPAVK